MALDVAHLHCMYSMHMIHYQLPENQGHAIPFAWVTQMHSQDCVLRIACKIGLAFLQCMPLQEGTSYSMPSCGLL